MSFAFIPLWGLSQGYQPAVGTNYGAKQYDRVKHITKVFAITATLLALIFYLPIMLVPNTILSMFITTPSVVELGVGDFRLFFLYFTPDSHLHTSSHHHALYCRIWCTWRICCSVYYGCDSIYCCGWYDDK